MTKRKNPEDKLKVGRPDAYTKEIGDRICELMSEGLSLRSICEGDEFPDARSVFRWLAKFPEFRQQYENAMELRAIYHAEELMDISDDGRNDWMKKYAKDGTDLGWQVNGEAIQRSRLRVDTRKWIASKLLPKKYGDKVDVTSGGEKVGLAINIDLGDGK